MDKTYIYYIKFEDTDEYFARPFPFQSKKFYTCHERSHYDCAEWHYNKTHDERESLLSWIQALPTLTNRKFSIETYVTSRELIRPENLRLGIKT